MQVRETNELQFEGADMALNSVTLWDASKKILFNFHPVSYSAASSSYEKNSYLCVNDVFDAIFVLVPKIVYLSTSCYSYLVTALSEVHTVLLLTSL